MKTNRGVGGGEAGSTPACLPPGQQLCWQNLSGVTVLELWSLSKACTFQEKPWTVTAVNFGRFQL